MRDRVVGLTCALSCSSSEETSSRHPGTPGLVLLTYANKQSPAQLYFLNREADLLLYPKDLGESLEFEIENLP